MITPHDALFNYAMERRDLTQWLAEDGTRDYLDSARYSEEQEDQLRNTLQGDQLTLFTRYVSNTSTLYYLERKMLFCQGLEMGILLGSLSTRC